MFPKGSLVTLSGNYDAIEKYTSLRKPIRKVRINNRTPRNLSNNNLTRNMVVSSYTSHGAGINPYMTYGKMSDEYMGGLWDFVKSIGKAVVSPIVSVAKGTGHAFMEFGRGAADGDIMRMAKSPFKGVGHAAGTMYRTQKEHLEWFWRPSKMAQWMKPIGGAFAIAGTIPTPLSPFLLGGGALLGAGGEFAKRYTSKEKEQEFRDRGDIKAADDVKKNRMQNYLITAGIIGAVGIGALLILR